MRLQDLWRDEWLHVGERLDALRRLMADDARKPTPITNRYQLPIGASRTFEEWRRKWAA